MDKPNWQTYWSDHFWEVLSASDKATENLSAASEDQLRKIIFDCPVMIAAAKSDATVIFWNKECENVTGYSADEMIGNPEAIGKLNPNKQDQSFLTEWKKKINSIKDWETIIITKSGAEKIICWSKYSDEMNIAATKAIWTIGIDVTNYRQTEEKLQGIKKAAEQLVKIRTKKLQAKEKLLKQEIEDRKRSEIKLKKYHKQFTKLSSELLLTEERERRQIAKDLHDRIGHNLTISRIKLGELKAAASKSKFIDAINEIEAYIKQTIKDTRSLIFEISPPILYEMGLEAALEWLAEQISTQYNIHVDFFDDGNSKPLDQRRRVLVFRASRELLLNTAKHSGAKNAKINILRRDNDLLVEVDDNGCGFETGSTESYMDRNGCFGLFSIQERLGYLDGKFELESCCGMGTRAKIIVPI